MTKAAADNSVNWTSQIDMSFLAASFTGDIGTSDSAMTSMVLANMAPFDIILGRHF